MRLLKNISAPRFVISRYLYYDAHMSDRCIKCFRPVKSCLCNHIKSINPGMKFVFLMHPQEAYKQRTGTGRLASLSLDNSEIVIDDKFNNNRRVNELLSDKNYYPMVLYPGSDAYHAESFDFGSFASGKELLVFLIDATWALAKKMMYRSKNLQELPKISFSNEYRSEFQFKKQPMDYCLSTIESSYYLLKELQKSGVCDNELDTEGLLNPFRTMVQFQLECEKRFS